MLITFETKAEEKRLFYTNEAGFRRGLLQALAATPFTVQAPDLKNLNLPKETVEAYELPQEVVDAMGPALQKRINKMRDIAKVVIKRQTENYKMVQLRDELLALPVKEAIGHTTVVDGEERNSVELVATSLNTVYADITNDGYTSKRLYEIEHAELA